MAGTPEPSNAVILVDKVYWSGLIRFDTLVEQGFVDAGDLKLLQFAPDGAEARSLLSSDLRIAGAA